MGRVSEWFGFSDRTVQPVTDIATVGWDHVLTNYDVVEVRDDGPSPYVIVADRPRQLRDVSAVDTTPDYRELGTTSPSPFVSFIRREYNRDLIGLAGLEKYDRMRKSDGVIAGVLSAIKTPVLTAHWFMEPATDSKVDQTIADFVWECLTCYMSISFPQLVQEALLSADFGFYMFEKVWEQKVIEGKERTILQKLAPRHPMDVKSWVKDSTGGPAAVVFWAPEAGTEGPSVFTNRVITVNGQPIINGTGVNPYDEDVLIPIDKLLVFSHRREAGNLEGISALRTAYKHWFYKEQLYKIDAIQKERHGIGIPVIKLPVGFKDSDKVLADELGRNLRTNERAHVVLPPNWELMFAKLEGHVVNALDSVKVHDAAIRESVLAGFLESSSTTKEEDQDIFLKAQRFMADIICETFNLYLIPQLVKYNFTRGNAPKLRARRIGEQGDWRTMSFAIRNLVGAGVITPDDKLEEWIREEMDLPKADPETARKVATPQGAPGEEGDPATDDNGTPQGKKNIKQNMNKNQVGSPRQTPPSSTPPRGNGGRDASGGK
jgi:hypothetical protein